MSFKAVAWTLLAALALAGILLLNYWGSYQPLSTLAYLGIVLALSGLANLAFPFRFLGIRKRVVGAIVLLAGVGVAFGALLWPAPMFRVAQHRTVLDAAVPEYQFFEWHSTRVHARPEEVMQAVRESTFGDMKSLDTLLKIRAAALRIPDRDNGVFSHDKRILDMFAASGFISGGSDHEVVMCMAANVREKRRLELHSLQECGDYREPGAFKMAFTLYVEEDGEGWSTLITETRVMVLDEATRRGMGRYWRLIVPGSGLLRIQWLEGIKKRAERMPNPRS